jgi:PAS domain S-box-containing protein
VANLAGMAAARTPLEMQPYLRSARESDPNFLRLGLLDRQATVTAYDPPLDERGQPFLGQNFADRSFEPQLKWQLRPMLGDVVPSRTAGGPPVIPVLAPVLRHDRYDGYVIGVTDLGQIRRRLDSYLADHGARFTLLDRSGNVLITDRADQAVMARFRRGDGPVSYVDGGISRWEPVLPPRTPSIEHWERSLFFTETPVGSVTEWRLLVEQPMAPFLAALFASYRYRFSLLLLLLALSLAAAEGLSRYHAASLREGEERFRSLFDNLTEGVALFELVHDAQGRAVDYRVLDVNPAYQAHTGVGAARARGALGSVLHPEAHGLYLERYGAVEGSGRPERFEAFFPSGGRHLQVSALPTTRGQFAAVLEDITERKQRETRLLEAHQFNEQVLRCAQEGIVVYDLDLRYRVWNSYMEALSGTPAADLLGRHPLEVYPFLHGTPVMARLERGLAGERMDLMDYRYQFPDRGRSGWALDSTAPMLDTQGRVIGVIRTILDITGRKQAELENAKLQGQLVQSQKMDSLALLVAGVAHNINNVLAVVMGTASLRDQAAADPADREAYQSISMACRRGREVMRSLIQFGQPVLAHQAPLDLHEVIREVRALVANISRNRVRVVEALAPEPLWIQGDAGSISHVLMNLCINALDAMAEGGILRLGTAGGPDQAEVTVADDGAGMAPEVLAHAMEPFYTTKEVGKGTGLGLSMSYGVVSAHGGSIGIESRPGEGTTVTLRFPRIPAPAPRAASAPAPAPAALGAMEVLLVDDDEDVRFLMARMLRKAGVRQVQACAGGEAALAALEAGARPDLVILDQNMPGLDGVQTMERIRILLPQMPVLISSGQPDIQEWDCFRRPGVGVISKPFSLEEIQAKLGQFSAG